MCISLRGSPNILRYARAQSSWTISPFLPQEMQDLTSRTIMYAVTFLPDKLESPAGKYSCIVLCTANTADLTGDPPPSLKTL